MGKKNKLPRDFTLNGKELIECWNYMLKKKKFLEQVGEFPMFDRNEIDMLTWLLFWKDPELRVWLIKKRDKRAIRKLIEWREAERQGIPVKLSTIYKRRMKFLENLLACNFNGAEAARRSGYSQRYAKQVAYKIRRTMF